MDEITTTKEKGVTLTYEAIVKEAKRIEENCLHTSKSHFVAANFWNNFHLWIGIPTIILAAIAGTIAFADFSYHNLIAGIISIIVTILTAVTTFLNPKENSKTHHNAGSNYDSLLTRVRIFWTIDCRIEESIDVLTSKLKDFSEQRERLNHDCSQPPNWAYRLAKKGIEEGEADYKVDQKDSAI